MPQQRKRRPTQADVARLAGVSQTTVSHVLNDSRAIVVPQETRQRILDAVKELGYVPNAAARTLRTHRTYTIASIIPDITNPFYPAVERGIQDIAEQHGCDLIVYNTDARADKEYKCLRSVQQGRVDGVITFLFHFGVSDLLPLLEQNIMVVRFASMPQPISDIPLDTLCVNNEAAARMAVNYLIERGHGCIGMLAGHGGPRQARVDGYRLALTSHQLAVEESLIQAGDFTEQGGYQAMRRLLEASPRPDAVFAANDLMALGALMALREVGLRVPEDVAIVGFDDIPAARFSNPPLTTVSQFAGALGQRAATMLFERLAGTAPAGGRCEELPCELIVRESA